jgi:hypothetical protein
VSLQFTTSLTLQHLPSPLIFKTIQTIREPLKQQNDIIIFDDILHRKGGRDYARAQTLREEAPWMAAFANPRARLCVLDGLRL